MKKEINPENIVRDFMILAKLPYLPPARREALRQAIEKELERAQGGDSEKASDN